MIQFFIYITYNIIKISMNSIIDDCYSNIISFLDIVSLLKMKLINKNNSKNTILVQAIEKYKITTEEEKQEFIDYFCSKLIKINKGFESNVFASINKKPYVYGEKEEIIKNIKNINYINIEYFDKLTNYHGYSVISHKNFDIDEIELYTFLQTMENLQGFAFYYLTKITKTGLYNFLKKTNIEYIRLNNCSIDDKEYYELVNLLPEKKISVSYKSKIYSNIHLSCCDMMRYY